MDEKVYILFKTYKTIENTRSIQIIKKTPKGDNYNDRLERTRKNN